LIFPSSSFNISKVSAGGFFAIFFFDFGLPLRWLFFSFDEGDMNNGVGWVVVSAVDALVDDVRIVVARKAVTPDFDVGNNRNREKKSVFIVTLVVENIGTAVLKNTERGRCCRFWECFSIVVVVFPPGDSSSLSMLTILIMSFRTIFLAPLFDSFRLVPRYGDR